VFGMVERGGRVRAKVIKSRSNLDLEPEIYSHVLPSAMIFTDEWVGYNPDRLGKRYKGHHRIRHEDRIYVDGNVHTQTIEGFFGLVKNGIRGVYHSVSSKYLQSYLTSTRGATTTATTGGLCSGRSSIRSGRLP